MSFWKILLGVHVCVVVIVLVLALVFAISLLPKPLPAIIIVEGLILAIAWWIYGDGRHKEKEEL